jgi:hypothetical protein
MAGLFGFFGRKSKYIDDVTESDRQLTTEKQDAFYLNADESKSFGNVEFMRKPITIRRTFPKTLSGEGREFIQQVSSMEKAKSNGNEIVPTTNGKTASTSSDRSERRVLDSSMDMFRNMARDIKK